jgi:hypothetical protein
MHFWWTVLWVAFVTVLAIYFVIALVIYVRDIRRD